MPRRRTLPQAHRQSHRAHPRVQQQADRQVLARPLLRSYNTTQVRCLLMRNSKKGPHRSLTRIIARTSATGLPFLAGTVIRTSVGVIAAVLAVDAAVSTSFVGNACDVDVCPDNRLQKCVYEHDNKAPCHGLEDENVRLRDRVSELETILRLYRGKPDVEISQRETYDWVLTIPEVIWHLMQGVVDFAAEADQIFNHISPVGEAGEVQRRLQEWLRGLSGTVSTAMHEARKSRRDMPADLHNGGHMPTPVSSPPSLAANFSTSPEHAVPPTYPAMHSPQSIHSQSPVIAQPIQEPVYHSYAGAVDGTVASYIEEATDLSAFYGDPSIYEAFVAMPQELGSNLFLEGWASEMNAYVTAG
ncbi:hypothetical protein CALCODRAFT_97784 [Calocera cornea HHB12733]|uniref:Uncharacterized protein n=1 Tax=Calocera cornea HHB12733 TaxID=1353952 RepID=A0A165IJW6_9BASI|nr:hypothetical protein CALCODRAFT_97784 [Calocera cornea HHB12733]